MTASKEFSRLGLQATLIKANRTALVQYSRMKRFRDALPAVIRPDVIPTQDGMVITELDSVPGGIGLTACLSRIYDDLDMDRSQLIGGRDGMVRGFAQVLRLLRASTRGVSRSWSQKNPRTIGRKCPG